MDFPEALLLRSDPIAGSGGSSRNFAPVQCRGWVAPGSLLLPRRWILEGRVGNGGAPWVVFRRSRRSGRLQEIIVPQRQELRQGKEKSLGNKTKGKMRVLRNPGERGSVDGREILVGTVLLKGRRRTQILRRFPRAPKGKTS